MCDYYAWDNHSATLQEIVELSQEIPLNNPGKESLNNIFVL